MIWIILLVFAGLMNGSFALPMKITTRWKWEHTWSMWSVWALLVVPWCTALLTVPRLFSIYAAVGFDAILIVFLFGLGWGVASVAFGKGIDYLGIGLGYSLMMGLIISIGAILPLFLSKQPVAAGTILAITAGVATIVAGLIFSAWAAVIKEKETAKAGIRKESSAPKSFAKGVIICLVTGLIAPMLNLAFIYGNRIASRAVESGASPIFASNATWAVALTGGFIVNFFYCLFIIARKNSWHLYRDKGTGKYYFFTFLMGLAWAGSILTYGIAGSNMGALGSSIGWALFNTIGIFWANCLGLMTGEWRNVSRKGLVVMSAGLAVLLLGVFIVGWANSR